MKRDTLLDFLRDRLHSHKPFIVHDDGYRVDTYTYDQIRLAAISFAHQLESVGIEPKQRVLIFAENRPEWIVALWGCLLNSVVVVPLDYRTSTELLARIVSIVDARAVILGSDVPTPSLPNTVKLWPMAGLMEPAQPLNGRVQSANNEALPKITEQLKSDDLAEIIFTSGATAEPKGVLLTHRNILANIIPVEQQIIKYRNYARIFSPLRFLNLLPLSHMFGQAMTTFIPPMLSGITLLMSSLNPSDIIQTIHRQRVSVIVCVPKILEILRQYLIKIEPTLAEEPTTKPNIAVRWWRYRNIHRLFGFKFWAFVVGAAPLDPKLEAFWSRLGFLVIQGYGMTEAAPIITLNHPFHARQGTVGTPIEGVDVKIAPDGEILIKGNNVTTGYYNAPEQTSMAFDDNGWFCTGDIGDLDNSGRLTVKGRKKELIVTPEGLNIFPADVERVLSHVQGIRDAAVVGALHQQQEQVHAIVVLEQGIDPETVIREANSKLEEHQKIHGFSLWPETTLPRTEGTQKLRRRDLQSWVNTGTPPKLNSQTTAGTAEVVLQRFTKRTITSKTTLEELGLSSIERIELMIALEQEFNCSIDELSFASTSSVGDLQQLVNQKDSIPATLKTSVNQKATKAINFPNWNQNRLARSIRRISLAGFLLPMTKAFAWMTVEGLDNLESVSGPVVYASNHQSHMDTPVILAALPSRMRYQVATAASKEFFSGHFHPEAHSKYQQLTSSLNYYLAGLLFNSFPLPQRETGTRDAIRYMGELLDTGISVLIFPEGQRTKNGSIDVFQSGIGMIAARLRVPIVPIRIEGLDQILHQSWRMAQPGYARVTFGSPLRLSGTNYPLLSKQIREAILAL